MNIRDLSPELQELVHKRQREQGNDGTFNGSLDVSKYDQNFNWSQTLEGVEFWNSINDGYSMMDSKHYPKVNYEIY